MQHDLPLDIPATAREKWRLERNNHRRKVAGSLLLVGAASAVCTWLGLVVYERNQPAPTPPERITQTVKSSYTSASEALEKASQALKKWDEACVHGALGYEKPKPPTTWDNVSGFIDRNLRSLRGLPPPPPPKVITCLSGVQEKAAEKMQKAGDTVWAWDKAVSDTVGGWAAKASEATRGYSEWVKKQRSKASADPQ